MTIEDLPPESGSTVMGVRRFHEITGRIQATQWEIEFNRSLMDPTTGLVSAEISESRDCPVCSSAERRPLFIKDGFAHHQCIRCGAIYVSPSLTDESVLRLFYGNESPDPFCDVADSPAQRDFDRPRFLRGLSHLIPESGRRQLLDIGCSTGFFMELAQECGWTCVGVEPYGRAAKKARIAGLNVVNSPFFAELFPPRSFDAITLWELLDHVPKPRDLLRDAVALLRPGGSLLIAVRNSESLAARVLQEKCHVFNGSLHFQLFSQANLASLCQIHGLQPCWHGGYISELEVVNNYLAWQDPYSGEDAPQAFPFLTEKEVINHGLAYKIVCVTSKPK